MWGWKILVTLMMTVAIAAIGPAHAQKDTGRKNGIDSLLLKRKGILGQLAHNLMVDTSTKEELLRNDIPYQPFQDKIIRKIIIKTLDFGTSIGDTSKRINDKLTSIANFLHHKTRTFVIGNNLFFRENQKLSPYLLGINERHLRDLPFLQDARIIVEPIEQGTDSVDIVVLTKDVLSIGGSVNLRDYKSGDVTLREDNFFGWGDRFQVQGLYDYNRSHPFGYGGEYIKRNIGGSFIDADAGYLNFYNSFNTGYPEDNIAYARFNKPLVNPYMLWTYGLSGEVHTTNNMFSPDTLYQKSLKYKYQVLDAWAGINLTSREIVGIDERERAHWLVSMRMFHQKFLDKPMQFIDHYFYSYADLDAVLGSISVFKQNFYKTRYIYGFGRYEDVPEGIEASFTGGWTVKEGRRRPYGALSFQRYFFMRREAYINYLLRLGSYFYNGRPEDINLLGNLDYFSRLHKLTKKWKEREYLNISFARQFNSLLNEPLFIESQYGLYGFKNNYLGGDLRMTVKAESTFFSPWSLIYFRFAPFLFGSATLFKLTTENPSKLYTAIGGGIRTRNESLIFGTIELRGTYYPKKDFFNNTWKIDINTNIRFKYNQPTIKGPDFVQAN